MLSSLSETFYRILGLLIGAIIGIFVIKIFGLTIATYLMIPAAIGLVFCFIMMRRSRE